MNIAHASEKSPLAEAALRVVRLVRRVDATAPRVRRKGSEEVASGARHELVDERAASPDLRVREALSQPIDGDAARTFDEFLSFGRT